MSTDGSAYKVKNRSGSGWAAYRSLVHGDQSIGRILLAWAGTVPIAAAVAAGIAFLGWPSGAGFRPSARRCRQRHAAGSVPS